MKTRLPIATISYNTDNYLQLKLNELVKARIISLWFYINHKAEEDEKKDHKHLYIVPAKTIQTDDLCDELIEFNGNDKPLKCLHFVSSKSFSDWFLYVLHDEAYLMSKGQKRKYHYNRDEIVSCDTDELDYLISQIDLTQFSSMNKLISAMNEGLSFGDLVMTGAVPVQLFRQYLNAWEFLTDETVYRNGRKSDH